eukprot:c22331_g1_i1 orf=346-1095(+)
MAMAGGAFSSIDGIGWLCSNSRDGVPSTSCISPRCSVRDLSPVRRSCASIFAPKRSFFGQESHSHLGSVWRLLPLSRAWQRHSQLHAKGIIKASLFGVGAPEAIVIAVVALLVFGPKGLAELARNLGKSLRAFQPTLRELQQVSREFKSTLEQEIGLDDLQSYDSEYPRSRIQTEQPFRSAGNANQNGPAKGNDYAADDYVTIAGKEAETLVSEEKQKDVAWRGTSSKVNIEAGEEDRSDGAVDNIGTP